MYTHCLGYIVRRSAFARPNLYSSRLYSTGSTKPLRILFCGSDEFSIRSLQALHREQWRNPQLIQSIDVLCRPGKLVGRGSKKTIRELPIKAIAKELRLTIHERDTFTGWDLPQTLDGPINLIIAVSFGLFVPPRILRSAEYGGLNVHPSLLPDFRGPAPLQYTILTNRRTTGITIQTMDEKSFDHGKILAQTKAPGLRIPNPFQCTHQELLNFMAPKAALMLVQSLRHRVFEPPFKEVGWSPRLKVHAPKITARDREVPWHRWSAREVDRRHRALGRLWSAVLTDVSETKRVIFEDIEVVPANDALSKWYSGFQVSESTRREIRQENDAGIHFMVHNYTGTPIPLMYVVDGDAVIFAPKSHQFVRVREMTMEGGSKKPARVVMQRLKDRELWYLTRNDKGHMGVESVRSAPATPEEPIEEVEG